MYVGDPGHCRDGKKNHNTENLNLHFRVEFDHTVNAACYCFTADGFLALFHIIYPILTLKQQIDKKHIDSHSWLCDGGCSFRLYCSLE